MIIFFLILGGVFTVSGIIVFWMELSITNDRLRWLEERLTKLEKDAVKVTFTGEPKKVPPCVGHELESQKEEKKLNSKQFESEVRNVIITTLKEKQKKRKPKTVKEWEDDFDLGGHE